MFQAGFRGLGVEVTVSSGFCLILWRSGKSHDMSEEGGLFWEAPEGRWASEGGLRGRTRLSTRGRCLKLQLSGSRAPPRLTAVVPVPGRWRRGQLAERWCAPGSCSGGQGPQGPPQPPRAGGAGGVDRGR